MCGLARSARSTASAQARQATSARNACVEVAPRVRGGGPRIVPSHPPLTALCRLPLDGIAFLVQRRLDLRGRDPRGIEIHLDRPGRDRDVHALHARQSADRSRDGTLAMRARDGGRGVGHGFHVYSVPVTLTICHCDARPITRPPASLPSEAPEASPACRLCAPGVRRKRPRRRLLPTTLTELRAIAAAASMGVTRPSMASGMRIRL